MKNLAALLITSAVLISAAENSSAISITEGVVDTAKLSDGSAGVDIRFLVTNDSVDNIHAFAVGNNTADGAFIRYTGDGEWAAAALITRPDTSSAWVVQPLEEEGSPEPGVDISWLTMTYLPGYTRAFYFENTATFGDIEPGESLGGVEPSNFGPGRFQGLAASLASPFAALGINSTPGDQTIYSGETVNISAVPLPASLFLFLSGLAGFGIFKRKSME